MRFTIECRDTLISIDEIEEALKCYFIGKQVVIKRELDNLLEPNEVLITESASDDIVKSLNEKVSKLTSNLESFHKQQQALFDEFVVLRNKYDNLKSGLIESLWKYCVPCNSELESIKLSKLADDVNSTNNIIGRFKVLESLGEGQFASVYSCVATHSENSKVILRVSEDEKEVDSLLEPNVEFAIKVIKKEKLTSFHLMKRLNIEIENLSKLKHSNIITLIDTYISPNYFSIVTEKVSMDLFDFLTKTKEGLSVNENVAKSITIEVLKAIYYCHHNSICHRDLKPENILISLDESFEFQSLKLCDFGLSSTFESNVKLSEFCGSPGFFDPEMIIEGKYFGDKADIWSIGCVLLEAILGHGLFISFWMSAYDYDIMQDRENFTNTINNTIKCLPKKVPKAFNENQLINFLVQLLTVDSSLRPSLKVLCQHEWLEGLMDADLRHYNQHHHHQHRLSFSLSPATIIPNLPFKDIDNTSTSSKRKNNKLLVHSLKLTDIDTSIHTDDDSYDNDNSIDSDNDDNNYSNKNLTENKDNNNFVRLPSIIKPAPKTPKVKDARKLVSAISHTNNNDIEKTTKDLNFSFENISSKSSHNSKSNSGKLKLESLSVSGKSTRSNT